MSAARWSRIRSRPARKPVPARLERRDAGIAAADLEGDDGGRTCFLQPADPCANHSIYHRAPRGGSLHLPAPPTIGRYIRLVPILRCIDLERVLLLTSKSQEHGTATTGPCTAPSPACPRGDFAPAIRLRSATAEGPLGR